MQKVRTIQGLTLIALAVLAILGWMRTQPAPGQQETSRAGGRDEAPPPRPGHPPTYRPFGFRGPTALAAGGSFVYVLRGNPLYQMRPPDLAVVNRKELPAYGP